MSRVQRGLSLVGREEMELSHLVTDGIFESNFTSS